MRALEEECEYQLLPRDGIDEILLGLMPQAAAFQTGLLSGTWKKADGITRAVQQAAASVGCGAWAGRPGNRSALSGADSTVAVPGPARAPRHRSRGPGLSGSGIR